MESLSTVIEFVAKGGGGSVPASGPQTGDVLSQVLIWLFVAISVFAIGALVWSKTYVTEGFVKTKLASTKISINKFVTIIATILMSICAIAFATHANLAIADTNDTAQASEKIVATVDEQTGEVSFENGNIQVTEGAPAIINQINLSYLSGVIGLDNVTWQIRVSDQLIYNNVAGVPVTELNVPFQNEVITVGATGLTAGVAKSLIGRQVATIQWGVNPAPPAITSIEGTVDAGEGVTVSLLGKDGIIKTQTTTDENGFYSFEVVSGSNGWVKFETKHESNVGTVGRDYEVKDATGTITVPQTNMKPKATFRGTTDPKTPGLLTQFNADDGTSYTYFVDEDGDIGIIIPANVPGTINIPGNGTYLDQSIRLDDGLEESSIEMLDEPLSLTPLEDAFEYTGTLEPPKDGVEVLFVTDTHPQIIYKTVTDENGKYSLNVPPKTKGTIIINEDGALPIVKETASGESQQSETYNPVITPEWESAKFKGLVAPEKKHIEVKFTTTVGKTEYLTYTELSGQYTLNVPPLTEGILSFYDFDTKVTSVLKITSRGRGTIEQVKRQILNKGTDVTVWLVDCSIEKNYIPNGWTAVENATNKFSKTYVAGNMFSDLLTEWDSSKIIPPADSGASFGRWKTRTSRVAAQSEGNRVDIIWNQMITLNGDAGVSKFTDEKGTATLVSPTPVERGNKFCFKVECKDTYFIESVKVDGNEITPGADDVYAIVDVSKNSVVDVVTYQVLPWTFSLNLSGGSVVNPPADWTPATGVYTKDFYGEQEISEILAEWADAIFTSPSGNPTGFEPASGTVSEAKNVNVVYTNFTTLISNNDKKITAEIDKVYKDDAASFPAKLQKIDAETNAALPSASLVSEFAGILKTYEDGISSLAKNIQEEIAKRDEDKAKHDKLNADKKKFDEEFKTAGLFPDEATPIQSEEEAAFKAMETAYAKQDSHANIKNALDDCDAKFEALQKTFNSEKAKIEELNKMIKEDQAQQDRIMGILKGYTIFEDNKKSYTDKISVIQSTFGKAYKEAQSYTTAADAEKVFAESLKEMQAQIAAEQMNREAETMKAKQKLAELQASSEASIEKLQLSDAKTSEFNSEVQETLDATSAWLAGPIYTGQIDPKIKDTSDSVNIVVQKAEAYKEALDQQKKEFLEKATEEINNIKAQITGFYDADKASDSEDLAVLQASTKEKLTKAGDNEELQVVIDDYRAQLAALQKKIIDQKQDMESDNIKYQALSEQISKTKEDLAKAELYPGDADRLNKKLADNAAFLEAAYRAHQSHDQVSQAIAQCEADMQALIDDMRKYIDETNKVKADIFAANQQVNQLQAELTAAVVNYLLFQEDQTILLTKLNEATEEFNEAIQGSDVVLDTVKKNLADYQQKIAKVEADSEAKKAETTLKRSGQTDQINQKAQDSIEAIDDLVLSTYSKNNYVNGIETSQNTAIQATQYSITLQLFAKAYEDFNNAVDEIKKNSESEAAKPDYTTLTFDNQVINTAYSESPKNIQFDGATSDPTTETKNFIYISKDIPESWNLSWTEDDQPCIVVPAGTEPGDYMFTITAVAPTTDDNKATEVTAGFMIIINSVSNDVVVDNNDNKDLLDIPNDENVANVEADELELENEAEPVNFAEAILVSFFRFTFAPISVFDLFINAIWV